MEFSIRNFSLEIQSPLPSSSSSSSSSSPPAHCCFTSSVNSLVPLFLSLGGNQQLTQVDKFGLRPFSYAAINPHFDSRNVKRILEESAEALGEGEGEEEEEGEEEGEGEGEDGEVQVLRKLSGKMINLGVQPSEACLADELSETGRCCRNCECCGEGAWKGVVEFGLSSSVTLETLVRITSEEEQGNNWLHFFFKGVRIFLENYHGGVDDSESQGALEVMMSKLYWLRDNHLGLLNELLATCNGENQLPIEFLLKKQVTEHEDRQVKDIFKLVTTLTLNATRGVDDDEAASVSVCKIIRRTFHVDLFRNLFIMMKRQELLRVFKLALFFRGSFVVKEMGKAYWIVARLMGIDIDIDTIEDAKERERIEIRMGRMNSFEGNHLVMKIVRMVSVY